VITPHKMGPQLMIAKVELSQARCSYWHPAKCKQCQSAESILLWRVPNQVGNFSVSGGIDHHTKCWNIDLL